MSVLDDLKDQEILIKGDTVYLRKLQRSDKEFYIKLRKAVNRYYIPDEYIEDMWEEAVESAEAYYMAAVLHESNAFVGIGTIRDRDQNTAEIGFDVDPPMQNKGIGTEIISLLIDEVKKRYRDKQIMACVYSDNTPSTHIIEKLGGKKIGEEPSELDVVIEKLKSEGIQTENMDAILGKNHIDHYLFDVSQ